MSRTPRDQGDAEHFGGWEYPSPSQCSPTGITPPSLQTQVHSTSHDTVPHLVQRHMRLHPLLAHQLLRLLVPAAAQARRSRVRRIAVGSVTPSHCRSHSAPKQAPSRLRNDTSHIQHAHTRAHPSIREHTHLRSAGVSMRARLRSSCAAARSAICLRTSASTAVGSAGRGGWGAGGGDGEGRGWVGAR